MKIGNDNTYMEISVDGGGLKELVIQGEALLKPSSDSVSTHGGMAVLAPFANRVRNGKYNFAGHEYQLQINDEENAIHGFAKDSPFRVTRQNESMCRIQTDLTGPGYPWTVRLIINYTLSRRGFRCSVTARNISSDPAPFQVGFHPYFTFEKQWTLASNEPAALLNYRDRFFPDGSSKILDPFLISSKDSMSLDNAFMSTGDILFISGERRLVLDRKGLDYLVLYNGVYSGGISLAIEPMSAPPDAFNNGIGLISLMPGATTSASFGVTLKD